MRVRRLQARGVRCLATVDVELEPDVNVFAGDNGSGKTSFLESVYLLGHGRSFRSRHAREVICAGDSALMVFGLLGEADGPEHRIGVRWHASEGPSIRVDGATVRSASELARLVPTLVVNADAQRILSDGAAERRVVLDWLMFHVEPGYHGALRRYRRALQQRNAALRGGGGAALSSWTFEAAQAGEALHHLRCTHVPGLLAELGRRVGELLGRNVDISFFPGWTGDGGLFEILAAGTDEDRRQQRTRFGPHRADLRFRTDGRPVHRMLSRGEGKLLIYALALAQVSIVSEQRGISPLLLLDDLPAELDRGNRLRFLSALAPAGVQTLITTVFAEDAVAAMPQGAHAALFHVKQGEIARVV